MPLQAGPAFKCYVVWTSLALLAASSHQERCEDGLACPGGRPLLASGCCPVRAGQTCQPATGQDCDDELGYSCMAENGHVISTGRGICHGQYDLRVTSIGRQEVGLAWTEFVPPDYAFEYILQYRAGNFHSDPSTWTKKSIGVLPQYTLKRLTPATTYFIRISILQADSASELGNTTETLIVETEYVEYCEHQNDRFPVGHTFEHGCEDNCTCLPTGQFECSPLCPEIGMPHLDEGCHVIAGNGCCDIKVSCPVGGESCVANGTMYPHGAEMQYGCQYCQCVHGELDCVYPAPCLEMEPTPSCPRPEVTGVDSECCPVWECVQANDTMCTYENRTYSHRQYFTSQSCDLCQCDVIAGVQCGPDCPPVVMVQADAACPDPHIRHDNCCDTLHCHDPSLDPVQAVQRMFALSYSPVTMTLSFVVDPIQAESQVPLYNQYEILYSNTSDPSMTWHRRVVQPVDVHLYQDQSQFTQPTDALTTDSAIVVDGRAYVTLAGMHPNTTYYVKITLLDTIMDDYDNTDDLQDIDPSSIAMVVVKTRPLDNVTSCFHSGREVFHGEPVPSPHCSQRCECHKGKVVCQDTCEDENVVVATSPSCPQPRLERMEGECCAQWRCYPTANGCRHNDVILESGQSVMEACQVCKCQNGSVHCTSICLASQSEPRPGCQLVNITGQCCPQWSCPLETRTPVGVESSVIVLFTGPCPAPAAESADILREKVLVYVTSHTMNQGRQVELANYLETLDVAVQCPGLPHKSRSKKLPDHDGDIVVIVMLGANFSSQHLDMDAIQELRQAAIELYTLLNTHFKVSLTPDVTLRSLSAKLHPMSYICEQGFIFSKGICVLSEIQTPPIFRTNPGMSVVQASADSVTLQWTLLDTLELRQTTALMLEYRKSDSVQWNSSEQIRPTVTSHTLIHLSPGQSYKVRLMALTPWTVKGRWTLGETEFTTQTSPTMALTSAFNLKISVFENCATIYWDALPSDIAAQVSTVRVEYKLTQSEYFTNRQQLESVSQTHVQLSDLQPDTPYTARVVLTLVTGSTQSSDLTHFLTRPRKTMPDEMVIAIVFCCAVPVVATIVVIFTCLLSQRSKTKEMNSGFENKTYGISLENNNLEPEPAANPAAN